MQLTTVVFYLQKEITSKLKIKATNGKELSAVDVFAKSLEYMKTITLAKLEGFDNTAWKILWTITIPAIWSLDAKQIMQEAAYKVCTYSRLNTHVVCKRWYYYS